MKRTVAALLLTASLTLAAPVPAHLADFSEEYQANPRRAAIRWFRQAKFELFIHYALASVLERGKPGLIELAGDKRVMDLLMEHVETLEKTAPVTFPNQCAPGNTRLAGAPPHNGPSGGIAPLRSPPCPPSLPS